MPAQSYKGIRDHSLPRQVAFLFSTAGLWSSIATACRAQIAGLLTSYRPETHYMRGPGPKWREKHGQTSRSL